MRDSRTYFDSGLSYNINKLYDGFEIFKKDFTGQYREPHPWDGLLVQSIDKEIGRIDFSIYEYQFVILVTTYYFAKTVTVETFHVISDRLTKKQDLYVRIESIGGVFKEVSNRWVWTWLSGKTPEFGEHYTDNFCGLLKEYLEEWSNSKIREVTGTL